MKICFVAGTLGRGGAERQLVFMLRALRSTGIDTRLLCLTEGEALEREIKDLGVDVRSIDTRGGKLMTLRNITNDLRREPADIVQSSHFYTNIYVSAAGRLNRIPSIGAIRSDLTFEFAENRFYGKYQLKLPSHLIANSRLAVERSVFMGVPRSKIDLVRNVVLSGKRRPRTDASRERSTNLLFVGRLRKEKRPELFVQLASDLKSALPDMHLRFRMIGDGPMRQEIVDRAKACGLTRDEFSVEGERPDIAKIYAAADILVLTSDHEGTPNVVLEALSNGVPAIATNVGGVPDILNDRTGIIVEPGDRKGLIDAASFLIKDPNARRRLGAAGEEFVKRNHSLDYLGERLSGIYCSLLERRTHGHR